MPFEIEANNPNSIIINNYEEDIKFCVTLAEDTNNHLTIEVVDMYTDEIVLNYTLSAGG
jgi:hypothetical protein